jgi:hypothetical protein
LSAAKAARLSAMNWSSSNMVTSRSAERYRSNFLALKNKPLRP